MISFRPGDIKDFVKKIKLEDVRIDQRKKVLIRMAERRVQARAKVDASTIPSPVKEPVTLKEPTLSTSEEVKHEAASTLSSSTPLSGARSPLHPSLPAKPGATSTPSKSIPSQESSKITPTPTPAAPIPAGHSPAPTVVTTDDQITRLEEVIFLQLHSFSA